MASSLWFKGIYMAPILAGEKTRTLRRPSSRLPQTGAVVRAQVGPRPPFALLEITSVRQLYRSTLDADYQAELEAIYPGQEQFTELQFRVIPQPMSALQFSPSL